MGATVIAFCGCGINTEIRIGGGMNNFADLCYFPCLCKNCDDIVQGDLLYKEVGFSGNIKDSNNIRCPKCGGKNLIPYDDIQLIGDKGDRDIVRWNLMGILDRELVITNGSYKCPKCNSMELTFFGPISRWD